MEKADLRVCLALAAAPWLLIPPLTLPLMLLLLLLLMCRPVKRLGLLPVSTRGQPAGPEALAEETAPASFYSRGRLPFGRRRKEGTRSAAQGPSRGETFLLTFFVV